MIPGRRRTATLDPCQCADEQINCKLLASPAGATYAQIVRACNRHFKFSTDRTQCIEIGKKLKPTEALETIRTCATLASSLSMRVRSFPASSG
jgi:hypothetical protein